MPALNGVGQAPQAAPWIPRNMIPEIAPGCLPTQFWVSQAQMPDGSLGVLLQLGTPGALWGNVIPADFAAALAEQLGRVCKASSSGLILPG